MHGFKLHWTRSAWSSLQLLQTHVRNDSTSAITSTPLMVVRLADNAIAVPDSYIVHTALQSETATFQVRRAFSLCVPRPQLNSFYNADICSTIYQGWCVPLRLVPLLCACRHLHCRSWQRYISKASPINAGADRGLDHSNF